MRVWLLFIFILTQLVWIFPAQGQNLPVTTDSEEARNLFQEALEQYGHFRVVESQALLDKALEADPDFSFAYALKAHMQLFSETGGEAWAAKAVELSGDVTLAEQRFSTAVFAYEAGNIDEALQLARQLRDDYRESWLTTALLGNIHLFGGGAPAGLEQILKAGIEHQPNHNALNNWLGYALRWQGKMDEAEQVFQANVERYPAQPNPYDSMANFYRAIEELQKAASFYERSIEADPGFLLASMFEPRRVKLSALYVEFGRYEDAETVLKENIHYYPDNPISYQAIAELYRIMDKPGLAEEYQNRAQDIDPNILESQQ
jgi:tetratricopeptide (TPR) repeat protein